MQSNTQVDFKSEIQKLPTNFGLKCRGWVEFDKELREDWKFQYKFSKKCEIQNLPTNFGLECRRWFILWDWQGIEGRLKTLCCRFFSTLSFLSSPSSPPISPYPLSREHYNTKNSTAIISATNALWPILQKAKAAMPISLQQQLI
jgi:hypothetical protein